MPKKPAEPAPEAPELPLQPFPFPGLGTVIHARTQEEALELAARLQRDAASQPLPS